MRKDGISFFILKLDLIIIMILVFGLYKNDLFSGVLIFICTIGILLILPGIKGKKLLKLIQILLIHFVLISGLFIFKMNTLEIVFYLFFSILISEIEIIEYKNIKEGK